MVVKRVGEHVSLKAADALGALMIVLISINAERTVFIDLHHVSAASVSVADALFGAAFLWGWQWVFDQLRLYSRAATIPSRFNAVLKGVLVVGIPTALYMRLEHPNHLTHVRAAILILGLFAYEFDRLFFTDYVINRLAARNPRKAIIVGSGRRAGKAWREIRTRYNSTIAILGFVDDRLSANMAPEIASKLLGSLDDLGDLIADNAVDLILIAVPLQSCHHLAQRAIDTAESMGVSVVHLEDVYASSRRDQSSSGPMFSDLLPVGDLHFVQLFVKRAIDIVVSATLLLLLLPLLFVIGAGIKLTSSGAIIFCQERYGFRMRTFRMYKFRTMIEGAERMHDELESVNEHVGPAFKMKNDPRVTRFGNLLRTTSLDELPQLWNVLIGNMSLVGPRPMSVRDVLRFGDTTHMRRFCVKAGMTGLWQVSGRSQTGFHEWIDLDIRYIERWSLRSDFLILVRTIGAVVKRSGAM